MRGIQVSNRKVVDTTRTDQAYWTAVLKAEGLGMNRGTTFPEDEKLANQEERQTTPVGKKMGRPRKTGPKGYHLNFTKAEAIAASRPTYIPTEKNGVFQIGGFRNYGPSVPYGAGKGQKGGRRGSDVSGAFIQYVGDAKDLARIQESQDKQESGRVTPSGYGPDV